MRIRTAFTLILLMMLAACSATKPTEAAAPEASASEPPPGAAGKISADMVGKVSPVPAFMGLGEHFNIEIQSQGEQSGEGFRHRVHLVWGMGTYDAEGTLFYRRRAETGMPDPSRRVPIRLEGTLDTAEGQRTIRVEIVTEACTDDADRTHPQRVKIALQNQADMHGCGELAVY